MKYLAKEFCKMTGLKPNTLRFYVDCGLISPTVNAQNNYKEYSDVDIIDYYYALKCRNMEIPIKGISEVLSKESLTQQLSWLDNYEIDLKKTYAIIEERIRGCKKLKREIEHIPFLMKNVIETDQDHGADIAKIDLVGSDILLTEESFQLISRWNEEVVNLFPFIKIKLEEIIDQNRTKYSVIGGIGFAIRESHDCDNLIKAPSYIYSKSHSIGIIIKLKNPFEISKKDLKPLYDYAKEHSYEFCSDLTSWLITMSHEGEHSYYYFAVRISVK